jgi:hypothetical protein
MASEHPRLPAAVILANEHGRCRWPVLRLSLLLCALLASPARAQQAADSGAADAPVTASEPTPPACAGRHIVLRTAADVPAELAREVQTDLSAELGRRGLLVCADGASASEPAAVVSLSVRERDAIIELDDRTTQKRVARDVRLDRVPPAGRALALAIAIDELLRASWAELTMRGDEPAEAAQEQAPQARAPAPAAERDTPREPVQTALRLGAGLGYTHSWSDYDALALLFDGELTLGRRGFVGLALGPSMMLPVDTRFGRVSAWGVASALSAGMCLALGKRVHGCGGARVGAELLMFSGDADAGARARDGSAWLVRGEGFVGLTVDLTERVRMRGQVGLGAPLHGVRARAAGDTLIGISGALVSSQITLQVEL